MKKIFVLALVLAFGLTMASFAFAALGTQQDSFTTYTTSAGVGINNTVHDLGHSHDGINYVAAAADPLQRICVFCHAPHNTIRLNGAAGSTGGEAGSAAFNYLPLWNHTLTTNLTYTMYENGSGAPVVGPKATQSLNTMTNVPGGVSLLCLSCHDGTIAVNEFGNTDQPTYSQSSGGPTMGAGYIIGAAGYLGNHHPIGFDYDDVIANGDTQIRSADDALFHAADPVRNHLYTGTDGDNLYMECATCHSVHNTGNTGESLLWRSDANSQMCLTCHIKGIWEGPQASTIGGVAGSGGFIP